MIAQFMHLVTVVATELRAQYVRSTYVGGYQTPHVVRWTLQTLINCGVLYLKVDRRYLL